MLYILVELIALTRMFDTRNKSTEVEGSKHFYMSDGASKDTYLIMHADGMNREMLKKFVSMEDRLLEIEKDSVCSGTPYIVEASLISNKIKENFFMSIHEISLNSAEVNEIKSFITKYTSPFAKVQIINPSKKTLSKRKWNQWLFKSHRCGRYENAWSNAPCETKWFSTWNS